MAVGEKRRFRRRGQIIQQSRPAGYLKSYSKYQPNVLFENFLGEGQLFFYAKGAEYGDWIDETGRTDTFDSGDLIEHPAGAIEFLARQAGLTSTNIQTTAKSPTRLNSFDEAYTTLTGWKIAGINDVKTSWINLCNFIAAQNKLILYFKNNKLHVRVYDSSANFTISKTGTPGNQDKFVYNPTLVTSSSGSSDKAFQENPIEELTIQYGFTPTEDIANEVFVNYFKNWGSNAYEKEAFVTADDSNPTDATRETAAATSQSDNLQIARLTVQAPFINDDTTATNFRNHLFDIHKNPRKIVVFTTWFNAIEVELGDIINIQHPMLTNIVSGVTTKKWFVRRIDILQDRRRIEIEAVELV